MGQSSSGRAALAAAALGAALALAAACGPVARAPAPSAPVPVAPAAAAPAGSHYRIDPARSELRILAYRAGPLARLGHNHVLLATGLAGEAWIPADPAGARFELAFPAAGLRVDAPAARAEEGAEFASVPTPADIEGTRRNLLGPQVLDAAADPEITVSGVGSTGAGGLVALARVRIRGRITEVPVPLALTAGTGPGERTVRGGFTVLQSALGLTPFSVGLGALQVRDDLAVRFRLVLAPVAGGGAAGVSTSPMAAADGPQVRSGP